MEHTYYHCEVYQYDEDDRNRIHEAITENVQAYTAHIDVSMPEWDEIEIRTEPDLLGKLFDGVDDSKFLGKVVNSESKYILVYQG